MAAALATILLVGCATTTDAPPPPESERTEPKPAASTRDGNVTFSTDASDLGRVLRSLAAIIPRNVVVMNGAHVRPVGPYRWQNVSWTDVLDTLAEDAGVTRFDCGDYDFLAPPEYEPLSRVNLETMIPAGFSLPKGSVVVGADTPLFDAFALISQACNTTIIADNAVASARTGELSMPEIDGVDAIEALIKSARLDTSVFAIAAGADHLLFHARGNEPRANIIANPEALNPEQRTALDRRVNLRLPRAEPVANEVGAYVSATLLETALPELSEQLGVRVTADPRLRRFPVNPCLMNGVTAETALRLIVNQWLAQDFVAEVREDSILLRPAEGL